MKNATKFIVRKNTQLTSMQDYVYCKTEETAKAVANCFNNETRSPTQYTWKHGAPQVPADHWCVTQGMGWVVAHTKDVRPGEWYIGIWDSAKTARDICKAIVAEKDSVDVYTNGVGPCRDHGFVIVNAHQHAHPDELWFFRHQIEPGEAFEYLDEPGQAYVAARLPRDEVLLPARWLLSTPTTAKDEGKWDAKVKRIKRWDDVKTVILPCVDPLDALRTMTSEGLDGFECLRRYEAALKTERFGHDNHGRLYVPVPEGRIGVVGGVVDGLTYNQVELAKTAWSMKLEVLQAQQRERDIEQARRNALPCDDVDELPNMVYVDVD
jgi:hypothetical protein